MIGLRQTKIERGVIKDDNDRSLAKKDITFLQSRGESVVLV